MPRYDYMCNNCNKDHMEIISIFVYDKRGALKRCPACKKHKLERVIGGKDYSFKLAGGGWPDKS